MTSSKAIDPRNYVVGRDATISGIDLDAEARAAADGISLSVLTRDALTAYLAS